MRTRLFNDWYFCLFKFAPILHPFLRSFTNREHKAHPLTTSTLSFLEVAAVLGFYLFLSGIFYYNYKMKNRVLIRVHGFFVAQFCSFLLFFRFLTFRKRSALIHTKVLVAMMTARTNWNVDKRSMTAFGFICWHINSVF